MKIQSPFCHSRVLPCLGGVLITALLALPGLAWSDGNGGNNAQGDEIQEKVEMASTAKVTIHEAIKAAINEVGGTVIEAELEEKPRVTWEVEVVTDQGKVMEVLVDVVTGAVVGVKEEKPEKKMSQEKGGMMKGKMGKGCGMEKMMRMHGDMGGMMPKEGGMNQ